MSFSTIKKSDGFTLVEILMVIAVLAILAAVLIPVVNGVGKHARLAKCAENKRQITSAYRLWLNDHNNMIWFCPAYPGFSPWGSPLIGDQKAKTQAGYFTTMLVDYGLEQATWTSWGQPIENRDRTVWYCPTTYDSQKASAWGSTYFYRNLSTSVVSGGGTVSIDMLGDVISSEPYLWDYLGNHIDESEEWPTQGHNVYGYIDGHVESK